MNYTHGPIYLSNDGTRTIYKTRIAFNPKAKIINAITDYEEPIKFVTYIL